MYNELTNSEMERDQIQEETRTYHRVDKDSTGSITWWEFLNFETTRILQQRHKVSTALIVPVNLSVVIRQNIELINIFIRKR